MTVTLHPSSHGAPGYPGYPGATVSIGRPALRVGVAGDDTAASLPIVVRRELLRDAQRARSLLRAGSHDPANYSVALEIEVAIAPNPASARAAVAYADAIADAAGTDRPETIRYIGTSHGLVTLIRDVYAAEVADAVILVPIDGSATAGRIREQVLPAFGDSARRVA
ncbi:hypothetical protein QSJ18_17720 [Gordonia sp. ABSL1-1]|uniref:hypothetical protein n=1 Tax=Gordonia sp. ABSL1-1 TaxID=3053923 RepID=UPI0025747C23|nr:hypothetical protein [Gordonia sp. ABSL1-1]MDL9938588.1 hypothetical protein [Gordonia sp. ABSL1-1]